MPVKTRVPKERQRFTAEVLALFVANERKRVRPFSDEARQLARLLGLVDLWWSGCHVNDRSRGPCHPPWCQAHRDWHTCRGVREELLKAAGM
jgi:hypothetical protein